MLSHALFFTNTPVLFFFGILRYDYCRNLKYWVCFWQKVSSNNIKTRTIDLNCAYDQKQNVFENMYSYFIPCRYKWYRLKVSGSYRQHHSVKKAPIAMHVAEWLGRCCTTGIPRFGAASNLGCLTWIATPSPNTQYQKRMSRVFPIWP